MFPLVSITIPPNNGLGTNVLEICKFSGGPEIISDVLYPVFNAALLIAPGGVTGMGPNAVVAHVRHEPCVKADYVPHPICNGSGEVVIPALPGNASEKTERVFVAPDELLKSFAPSKL